ncbi:Oxidation resistance 1 [Gossypium arboreum]|uniref:Oxidation resistance protein 1 n=2 Tax=Gossypium arboreum TaxID=29729 RepID=A0A0B0N259_GOSAR|nr:uncharacterized protein LOC108479205 [Gossypium arboreum]KAK5775401.1 hypothetical protein PVK06_043286 [Gossypium arboreum]KHG05829.1 Oxidation resistance 1 [Gossypium arboreum]
MGMKKSLRSKAVHFVTDLTTGLLNPISDKSSSPLHPPPENVSRSKRSQLEKELISKEEDGDLVDGPDTSSFTAFLYSLLSSSESGQDLNQDEQNDNQEETGDSSDNIMKENGRRKSLLSRGKQSLRALYQATRISGNKNKDKGDSDTKSDDEGDAKIDGLKMRHMQNVKEPLALGELPEASEPSLLLTEKTRNALYASLPAIVQGRKWLLLYSTWRHGISLSTLYRRSMLWPGLSLLVVGDRKGAVFGGLVEAPLKPTNKKYQGTNSTFVFTDRPGDPVIFRPTGANRYFTLCSTEFLAIGGGSHFALYLDCDLLNGSSSFSETYGNPCLALSEDFEVKEIELWGFVYGSKYDEILALSRTEMPGICRW